MNYRQLKAGDEFLTPPPDVERVRVVRPLRKIRGHGYVLYVVAADQPREFDEASWEDEDCEEFLVADPNAKVVHP